MNAPDKKAQGKVEQAERENRSVALFGAEPRRLVLEDLAMDGEAAKFVHIEAVVSDPLGILYTRQDTGGLIAVVKVEAVSNRGMEAENLLYNSKRIAAVLDALPPEITVHSWIDHSPEPIKVVAEDWHNEFLAEQERERNKMNASRVNWCVTRYIALEWKGDFSLGGPVELVDMIKASLGFVKSKVTKGQEREAGLHKYNFMAYFKPEMQIRRAFVDMIEREVMLFNNAINDFIAALTSEQSGVGAYKDFGSLVEQMYSPNKVLVKAIRLNAEEALRALYELVDPDPRRREGICIPEGNGVNDDLRYGLHYILGKEHLNFSYLLSIAKGHSDEIKDPDIRVLGEQGPYLVGGIPRQIVAIRSLPMKGLSYDLFEGLRRAKVPFTVRMRWNGLSKRASVEWVQGAVESRRKFASRSNEALQAKAYGIRFEQGMDKDEGLLGMGSVLIALNGVPLAMSDGTIVSGVTMLRRGIEAVRKWATDNQVHIDFLNEDQPNAHYAMLPGAWHLDPLEAIPIRSLTMGKLLPVYSVTPEMPENTSSPGYPILSLRDIEGALIERGLEVGSVGSGAICGGMGSGKSYFFADMIANFHKNEGLVSQGGRRPISIDCFEFGDGSENGSSFNSIVRLLGGRVVQFGRDAITSDAFNPFDAPVRFDPSGKLLGYAPETVITLSNLVVTMAGGLGRDGGSVTPEMLAEFKDAITRLGQMDDGNLAGRVRSLPNLARLIHNPTAQQLLADWFDPMALGRYFPATKDTTRSRVVNYNFPLAMDPKIKAVLFSAVISRMEERGLGSGPEVPKLMLGDEVGAGLKKVDSRDDAVVESARRMLKDLYTNGRRFGMRPFIAFQEPGQILSMGDTLTSTVQNLCTTYFLFTQTDEVRSKELFRLSDAFLRELKDLPKYHVGIIQEGQLTVAVSENPPYGHAARTTQAQERALRSAMMACGRWGKADGLDLAGLTRELAKHLAEFSALQSSVKNVRFDRLIREYEEEGQRRSVGERVPV
jgi:hypothetical protein